MSKKSRLWRAMTSVGALLLALVIMASLVMETYRTSIDAFFGTRSQRIVTDQSAHGKDAWTYASEFKTAKSAYQGFIREALQEAPETFALLKNDHEALPLAEHAKVTMLGIRGFAPIYGSSGGSVTDGHSTEQITQAFTKKGLRLNPSTLQAYQQYFKGKKWTVPKFGGGILPEYAEITKYNDPCELSIDELTGLNPDFRSQYVQFGDAAIVVVGRPGGENGDGYYPGKRGLATGVSTSTGNILALSQKEKEIIGEAESHFKKVVVLINSVNPMEIGDLKDDPRISAIMWIGFPGAYGFEALADVLTGVVSPSARLGDVMARNSALAPAMGNYGNIPWANAADFSKEAAVNSYLIEAEGIYTGYRYYETRYADIVGGKGGKQAKAGTWSDGDGAPAAADGEWSYDHEVVYPFGYGLSYTNFRQHLDSVKIAGDKRTAKVRVTVSNTGEHKGKSVVQVYGSAPYTDYDRRQHVEKSAIALLDFAKTDVLKPGKSQTVTMTVDLANLASYDTSGAGTYILDPGDYFIAIGDDAHQALNSVLAAQGASVPGGHADAAKAYRWSWQGGIDDKTFSTAKTGKKIVNHLSRGDYALDYNAFKPGSITYLTRSDWSGTFPSTYKGFKADGRLATLLNNDFVPLKHNADAKKAQTGNGSSSLTINDMKNARFDDPRWKEVVDKVPVKEFMSFAEKAFHAIGAMPSVGLQEMMADDGPGGSDSHYLKEGTYRGKPYADADKYADKGSRVAPSPVNLAYSWNKALGYRHGQITLGESSLVFNLPIMIGPAMNLHRHAYNSRAVEYYSEDPILSGYMGSAVTQGAQSKGTLVNIKHAAFNDQEINRSGIAVFMSEQKAREMDLRNIQQAFEAKGKPDDFDGRAHPHGDYRQGALGVMTSYNRIGAVASSANVGVMNDIMRNEWGFTGYSVTDFTSVSPHASPKESLLAGTTAFCGFGNQGVEYWNPETLSSDKAMLSAIRKDIHYALWALANSNAMNGVNETTHTQNTLTWWRGLYLAGIALAALATLLGLVGCVLDWRRLSGKSLRSGVDVDEGGAR